MLGPKEWNNNVYPILVTTLKPLWRRPVRQEPPGGVSEQIFVLDMILRHHGGSGTNPSNFSVTTQYFLRFQNFFSIGPKIHNFVPSSFWFYKGLSMFLRCYHKKKQNQPLKNNSGMGWFPPHPPPTISGNQYAVQSRVKCLYFYLTQLLIQRNKRCFSLPCLQLFP